MVTGYARRIFLVREVRMKRIALALFLAGLIAPLHADTVKMDYDHNANFGQFHTYSWGQVKADNPLYVSRIRDAVNRDLQAKGWQLVPSGGDATVFATGNIRNEKQVETYYNNLGWGGGWGWRGWGGAGLGEGTSTSTVVNQQTGQVLVDIFSSDKKQLVWRGMLERDISNNSNKNAQSVDKDINKMFQHFPPKGSAKQGE